MKKIIILLFAFWMIFCLVGCSKTNTSNQNSVTESSVINNAENTVTFQEDNDILLSVLYNKKPFITTKSTTVYLKDYKPFYKYSEDVDYYEKDDVFVPRDYTFVDLDNDGKKELVVAEAPYADTYLILRKEDEKIYGYSLYIRWFQSLKQDGSFIGSGGALIHDYNTISFNENTYDISTIAKYYLEPDYEKSVFEINGKQVSLEEIEEFTEEWDKRPDAEWIGFEQTN